MSDITQERLERRDKTEEGRLLRAALDQVAADVKAAGKTTALVAVFDGDGFEIGGARISDGEGWDISAGVRAGVKQGRFTGLSVRVTLMK